MPSPYGGVPPVGAPPGQQNRTPLFVALGALGAAAVVLLVVLLASGGDDDNPSSTNTTEDASPGTTDDGPDLPEVTLPPDEPDDPGTGGGSSTGTDEIAVGEIGFSQYFDELDETDESTYAFYLENTSDRVATNVEVNVGLLSADGTVLDSESLYLGAIMPGAKLGIANSGFAAGIAEVQVQVGEGYELEDPANFGEVTVEGEVAIEFDSFNDPILSFTAKSTYPTQLDSPSIYILFRDANGVLIGGTNGYATNFIPANGSAAMEVESFDSIQDFDPAKTEIYFDPGFL